MDRPFFLTMRVTPASISAFEQGPVGPVRSHGSSVTTKVASVSRQEPTAAAASRKASTSAWAATLSRAATRTLRRVRRR